MIKLIRRVIVSLMLSVAMSQVAAAEEMRVNLPVKFRGSATVSQKKPSLLLSACGAGRLLGLCGDRDNGFARAPGSAWLQSKMFVSEEESIPLLPKNLTKVVKLFMEDVQIAQVGNWKVKLKVSFE